MAQTNTCASPIPIPHFVLGWRDIQRNDGKLFNTPNTLAEGYSPLRSTT